MLLDAHPGAVLRRGPPAAGARHEPRRLAVRRPARALPRPPGDDPARASRSPGAAPTGRSSGPRSPSSTSPRRSTASTADEAGPGRASIAVAGIPEVTIGETLADPDDPRPLPVIGVDEPSLVDDDRHQHLAAVRARTATRLTATHGQGAARPGARRQRLAARAADRAAGRLGGAGPRRAPARGARRDDAPRGLRAHRRQAAGRHARDRRRSCTSRSSAWRSTCRRSTSA